MIFLEALFLQTSCKYILGSYLLFLIFKLFIFRMDCTFHELMTLIKDVNPDTRRRGTEFSFAIGKKFFLIII